MLIYFLILTLPAWSHFFTSSLFHFLYLSFSPCPHHSTLTSFLPLPLSSPVGPLCVGEISKHCGFSVSLGIGMILCALNGVWITFYLKEPTVQGLSLPPPSLLFPSFIYPSIHPFIYLKNICICIQPIIHSYILVSTCKINTNNEALFIS